MGGPAGGPARRAAPRYPGGRGQHRQGGGLSGGVTVCWLFPDRGSRATRRRWQQPLPQAGRRPRQPPVARRAERTALWYRSRMQKIGRVNRFKWWIVNDKNLECWGVVLVCGRDGLWGALGVSWHLTGVAGPVPRPPGRRSTTAPREGPSRG